MSLGYSEIKNILITTVMDNEFNDIRLAYRLELAADLIYDKLLDIELNEALRKLKEDK